VWLVATTGTIVTPAQSLPSASPATPAIRTACRRLSLSAVLKDGRQVHSKGIIVKTVSKMSGGARLRCVSLCFASRLAVRFPGARQQRIGSLIASRATRCRSSRLSFVTSNRVIGHGFTYALPAKRTFPDACHLSKLGKGAEPARETL